MELFDYLMAKKSHNSSIHGDLFSYLLGKKSSTSGVYTTYTGQTFNIANTVRAKIKNWILGGNTEQTSEPTPDNPQEINIVKGNNSINITNKNILNINRTLGVPSNTSFGNTTKRFFNYNEFVLGITLNNYYESERITNYSVNENSITLTTKSHAYGLGMVVKVKGNTQYSLSYETDITTDSSSRIAFYEEDGSCLINSGVVSTSTNNYLKFTTPETASFVVIIFSPAANISTTYKNIQLEEGNTITSYIKYQIQNYPINLGNIELCKIGDYQDEIKASDGTNLFDKNNANILNAFFAYPDKRITTSKNAKMFYISCKDNTTYTISKISSERFRVMTTETIPEIDVVGIDYAQKETGTHITIITSSNAHYLCVYYFLNGTDTLTEQEILDSIQVEYGSQVTEYQPYGIGTWYLKKNIGKSILNGTENWQDRPNFKDCDRFALNSRAIPIQTINGFSNLFLVSRTVTSSYPILITSNGMQIVINYSEKGTTSLEQFINWVSTNNIIVYYVLSNPVYTVITDTNLINQLNALLNSRSYNDLTNIEQINENLPFNISLDIKVTSINLEMNNSLNTNLLSSNIQNEEETNIDDIQEEPNFDDVNEIEDIEQNDEPIENEEIEEPIEEEYQEL